MPSLLRGGWVHAQPTLWFLAHALSDSERKSKLGLGQRLVTPPVPLSSRTGLPTGRRSLSLTQTLALGDKVGDVLPDIVTSVTPRRLTG
jgi:hypothetical protein